MTSFKAWLDRFTENSCPEFVVCLNYCGGELHTADGVSGWHPLTPDHVLHLVVGVGDSVYLCVLVLGDVAQVTFHASNTSQAAIEDWLGAVTSQMVGLKHVKIPVDGLD